MADNQVNNSFGDLMELIGFDRTSQQTDIMEICRKFLGNLTLNPTILDRMSVFNDEEKKCERIAQISVDERFNMMLLRWQPGVANVLHDHSNSRAYFKVLRGRVKEVHYNYDVSRPQGERLRDRASLTINEGEMNDLDNFRDYHRVFNVGDRVAVTIHIYIPPLRMCRCINQETEDITDVWMDENARGKLYVYEAYRD
ncbi:unnamed protein product [Lymnaea stagnalis]|uniref:Cysteine dioxygenase n=1 Tax=Lymnaea stagnalis TaxID=6523 RepID=A0AAV2H9F9_LYMST